MAAATFDIGRVFIAIQRSIVRPDEVEHGDMRTDAKKHGRYASSQWQMDSTLQNCKIIMAT
jgi:hypothetical protein